MSHILDYKRDAALQYAKEWALKRNPDYLDFAPYGGDCTNFVSQCIYAGGGIMNHTSIVGWYYFNSFDRSPSWTGVPYLYNFLVGNKAGGPFAIETGAEKVLPGDIVQLYGNNQYYHTLIILQVQEGHIFVAAHDYDAYMRPLDSYEYERERFLHILNIRV